MPFCLAIYMLICKKLIRNKKKKSKWSQSIKRKKLQNLSIKIIDELLYIAKILFVILSGFRFNYPKKSERVFVIKIFSKVHFQEYHCWKVEIIKGINNTWVEQTLHWIKYIDIYITKAYIPHLLINVLPNKINKWREKETHKVAPVFGSKFINNTPRLLTKHCKPIWWWQVIYK